MQGIGDRRRSASAWRWRAAALQGRVCGSAAEERVDTEALTVCQAEVYASPREGGNDDVHKGGGIGGSFHRRRDRNNWHERRRAASTLPSSWE
jgi:hypothetical protein